MADLLLSYKNTKVTKKYSAHQCPCHQLGVRELLHSCITSTSKRLQLLLSSMNAKGSGVPMRTTICGRTVLLRKSPFSNAGNNAHDLIVLLDKVTTGSCRTNVRTDGGSGPNMNSPVGCVISSVSTFGQTCNMSTTNRGVTPDNERCRRLGMVTRGTVSRLYIDRRYFAKDVIAGSVNE